MYDTKNGFTLMRIRCKSVTAKRCSEYTRMLTECACKDQKRDQTLQKTIQIHRPRLSLIGTLLPIYFIIRNDFQLFPSHVFCV